MNAPHHQHRLALPIALLLLAPATLFAQPGSAGFPLLKMGVTGKEVGMGYATVLADGPAAVTGNPAGIAGPIGSDPRTSLQLTHQEWIQDARTEYLGFVSPLSATETFGFSLLTQTVSDIEVRTRPGDAEGTFTSRDLAVGLTYARQFGTSIRAGITGRFLFEKMYVNDATGYALDFGVRAALPVEGMEAGVAVLNLGKMGVLQQEATKLPALLRAGVSFGDRVNEQFTYSVVMEGMDVFPESQWYPRVGGEIRFQEVLAVRAGSEFGSGARGMTAGLGFVYGMASFDYALARLRDDLGTTHTISLTLAL